MRTEYLCISVLRVASGPRVKLASCKSALNPTVVYFTDHYKAVVPVLVLLFVALWFILRGDLFYVLPCVILFLWVFFSPFSTAITSLGEEKANLSVFRTFVRSICACLVLSVSSSAWCLGTAAVCDCCTPWTSLISFFLYFPVLKDHWAHSGTCYNWRSMMMPTFLSRVIPLKSISPHLVTSINRLLVLDHTLV